MVTKTYTPLASFIDLLMDAVFAVDADANVVFASAACERILGYTPQEMIGKNMFDLMVPEDRERTRQSVVEIMSGKPQFNYENRYIRKDGEIAHIMWATRWSPAEQLRIGVARDITGRKHAESMQAALYAIAETAYAAQDLLTLFQNIHQIIGTLLRADNFSVALYDKEADELSFPYHVDEHEQTLKAARPMLATLCAEIIDTGQPLLVTSAAEFDSSRDVSAEVKSNPNCWLGVPLKSQNGTIGVLVVKSYPGGVRYTEKDQELLQFVSTQIAIVIERQQMQQRLQHMAQYDQLTVLPNRGLLHDRLKAALRAARQTQGRFSLLYIDLDKFKPVNDTLGHGVGDLLLQAVAQRLKQCVRESDTVARVGGDEFVVLLQHVTQPEHAALVAEKIRGVLSKPFEIEGHSLNIAPSIGIAQYPENGHDEQQLLRYADSAMYLDKNGGSGSGWRIGG